MNTNSMSVENYALLTGFRTSFDEALQAAWCNDCRCGACQPTPQEPGPVGAGEFVGVGRACKEGFAYPMPINSVSRCSPPMQSGPFPKQLIKYGAMQKIPTSMN